MKREQAEERREFTEHFALARENARADTRSLSRALAHAHVEVYALAL